jgi:hypothetical protein
MLGVDVFLVRVCVTDFDESLKSQQHNNETGCQAATDEHSDS